MRVLASTALPMQLTRHPPKLPLSISVSREIERRSFTSTALREATSNAHDNGDGTAPPSASTPVGGRAPIGGRCAPSLELGADPEPSDDAGTHPRHLTRPLFALAQIGPASQSGCRAGIAAPPAGLWASERFCMQQPFACALAMLLPCHLYVCLMSRICMMCAGGVRSVRSMSGRRGRWRQCRAGGAHAWQHDVYTVRCACAPSAQLFVAGLAESACSPLCGPRQPRRESPPCRSGKTLENRKD